MSNWLVEVMNETRKKEALRNDPNMKPHEYSNFCSCGSCHSISLYADSIRAELVKRLPKEKKKTASRQLYTFDRKAKQIKYYEKDSDVGYNQCLQEIKERIKDGL